jgi:hypothetical protein
MAQQQFAGFAVLVVVAFMLLALAACANSAQGPVNIAPIAGAPGTPEFHDASIGRDTLRGHLRSE